MHPPLDRSHPDCQEEIQALKKCHERYWNKITGQCNDIKVYLDHCLVAEKKRFVDEMNKDLPERRKQEEEFIKKAFGKKETFSEFLAKDKEYQQAMKDRKQTS